jgi:predicted DNA-binding transcriptional regulator YafY
MGVNRVHRLLQLITVLQRDEPNTTEGLLKELGVSRRTFFRDLRLLQEAGVPYQHDKAQGYHVDKSFFLPPVNLTVTETLGLMLLGKSAATQRGRPMVGPALSAIYKLIATIPDPIREACNDLMANVSITHDPAPDTDLEARYHTTFQRCIDQGSTCRVVYQSPAETDDLHAMLNPYLLHYVNRAWYVLGYTDIHDEVRMLKLVRFIEIQPTDERFDKPENFRIEDKLGAAWRLIPEGKEHKIVLLFSKKVATNVSEVRWHKSQQHKFLDDGRCEMTFTIDGINEIAWWLCGYGDQVVVVKPPELRDRVEAMLRSALKQYETSDLAKVVTLGREPKSMKKTGSNQS